MGCFPPTVEVLQCAMCVCSGRVSAGSEVWVGERRWRAEQWLQAVDRWVLCPVCSEQLTPWLNGPFQHVNTPSTWDSKQSCRPLSQSSHLSLARKTGFFVSFCNTFTVSVTRSGISPVRKFFMAQMLKCWGMKNINGCF